ncbi:MAG: hypothetical protein ACPLXS_02490 [Candidatus Micrarchaeales archaeon]
MREKEIDFVVKEPIIPIEVKSAERVNENELKAIKYFIKRYSARKGIIVYNGREYITKEDIESIPILLLLVKGSSILK